MCLFQDFAQGEATTYTANNLIMLHGIQAQYEGELHQKDIIIQQKDAQLNEIQQQVTCLQVRQLLS